MLRHCCAVYLSSAHRRLAIIPCSSRRQAANTVASHHAAAKPSRQLTLIRYKATSAAASSMPCESPSLTKRRTMDDDIHSLADQSKSYVHGCSKQPPLLYETVAERLRMAAKKWPNREFVIFKREDMRKSYAEVLADSERLAAGLVHLGMEKGDRLGIWSPNKYEWITAQFASALGGFILVNVNPMYHCEDLRYAIGKVGIKTLITTPTFKRTNYYGILRQLMPELEKAPAGAGRLCTDTFPTLRDLIIFDAEKRSFNGAWAYDAVLGMGTADDRRKLEQYEASSQPDDLCNIQYTSGTTGKPKGATLTHHNLVNSAFFVGLRAGYGHDDDAGGADPRLCRRAVICIPNPLYHCFGCVMGTLAALVHGQTCVFPSPAFEPLAALRAIDEEKCTAVYGTPTMYIDMMSHVEYPNFDYSSVRSGIVAGAPCPITLCSRLVNELGMKDLQVCYGTTETQVSFMSVREDPAQERIRNVGHIMDHLEALIVDAEGHVTARGQRGELLIRGYSVMYGYWDSNVVQDGSSAEITKDRWYRTGDIAVMHPSGTVSIVGRSKDMIVRGGENIYPTEVEQFIITHPAVADVHIVGVPDDRYGEALCAWIRLKNDVTLTDEQIREYCKGKIAHHKIPKYILFKDVSAFPMTVTGKIKKFEMREISLHELGLQKVKSHFSD